MTTTSALAIVGGDLAAAKSAEALRANDCHGSIVMIGLEGHLPYERLRLSKEFLADKKSVQDFTVHDSGWYGDSDVEFRSRTEVVAIDRSARTVVRWPTAAPSATTSSCLPPARGRDAQRSLALMPPPVFTKVSRRSLLPYAVVSTCVCSRYACRAANP